MAALTWTKSGPSGEDFAMLEPHMVDRPKPALIFCPQAGGQAEYFMGVDSGDKIERAKLFHRLAGDGWVCATSDFGGSNTMGNDNATGRVKQVYDYLQTIPGVKPGPAIMVGTSMGNNTALSFARRYPGTVKGVLSFFGMTDGRDIYATDRAGLRATVGNAWGVTYPTPLPTNASPILYAPTVLKGLPWRGFTAADDPVVIPQEGEAFAAAMGPSAKHTIVPSGNHSDGVFQFISYKDDIIPFLAPLST